MSFVLRTFRFRLASIVLRETRRDLELHAFSRNATIADIVWMFTLQVRVAVFFDCNTRSGQRFSYLFDEGRIEAADVNSFVLSLTPMNSKNALRRSHQHQGLRFIEIGAGDVQPGAFLWPFCVKRAVRMVVACNRLAKVPAYQAQCRRREGRSPKAREFVFGAARRNCSTAPCFADQPQFLYSSTSLSLERCLTATYSLRCTRSPRSYRARPGAPTRTPTRSGRRTTFSKSVPARNARRSSYRTVRGCVDPRVAAS